MRFRLVSSGSAVVALDPMANMANGLCVEAAGSNASDGRRLACSGSHAQGELSYSEATRAAAHCNTAASHSTSELIDGFVCLTADLDVYVDVDVGFEFRVRSRACSP